MPKAVPIWTASAFLSAMIALQLWSIAELFQERTPPVVSAEPHTHPVDLTKVVGLFGEIAAPPSEIEVLAGNVFEPVTLIGLAWRERPERSYIWIALQDTISLARIGSSLRDGSFVADIGPTHAVVYRGTVAQRLELPHAAATLLASNPFAGASDRILAGTYERLQVGSLSVDQTLASLATARAELSFGGAGAAPTPLPVRRRAGQRAERTAQYEALRPARR